MTLLIPFQIVLLALGFFYGGMQEGIGRADHYSVVMYRGIPPESIPEDTRRELPPEEALLTANVDGDGRFQAEEEGVMFEGRLFSVKEAKVVLEIEASQLYTTSCFPITVTVMLDEAVSPDGCMFSSIAFSYYFRVKNTKQR